MKERKGKTRRHREHGVFLLLAVGVVLLAVLLAMFGEGHGTAVPLPERVRVLLAEMNRPVVVVTGSEGLTPGEDLTPYPSPPGRGVLLAVRGALSKTRAEGDGGLPVISVVTGNVATVTVGAANVRSGPGVMYAARYWLFEGQRVVVTGCITGWARVEQGWVYASLLDGDPCGGE